jgi:hypothetical protein
MMPESLCLIARERRTLNVQVRATIASMCVDPSKRPPFEWHQLKMELKMQLERDQRLDALLCQYAALSEMKRLPFLMVHGFVRDWPPPDAS